jgi:hypothetical protein
MGVEWNWIGGIWKRLKMSGGEGGKQIKNFLGQAENELLVSSHGKSKTHCAR